MLACLRDRPKIRHNGANFHIGCNKTPSTDTLINFILCLPIQSSYNDHLESHLIHVHYREYDASFEIGPEDGGKKKQKDCVMGSEGFEGFNIPLSVLICPIVQSSMCPR